MRRTCEGSPPHPEFSASGALGRRSAGLRPALPSFDNDLHGPRHVFDAGEKTRLVEKSVIDGEIEAAAGFGIEETPGLHHGRRHQNPARRVGMNRRCAGQSMSPAKPMAARMVEGSGMAVMVKELPPLLMMLLLI